MDEFEKIKELSDDIMGRKEPSFNPETAEDEPDSPFLPMDKDDVPLPPEIEEKEIPSYRIHFIALGALVVVLAVILTGFLWFGRDEQPDGIITISPTPDPVRITPEEPGGIEIPDQGKQIYNRINATAVPVKVEQLFPEPEKPVLPEILIRQATPEPEFVAVENINAVNPLSESPAPIIIVEEEPIAPKKEVMTLPAKQPVKAAEKPTQAVAKEEGGWRVQLISTSKKATAEKAWTDISKKHKALLSDMSHDITTAEIAGKGTFYRLQVGHFTTRDKAKALCDKLAAQKQACVPVKQEK